MLANVGGEPVATIAEAIALALQYQQRGDFTQAENLYRQVLQADGRNFDALHLLGVLASQQGNNDLAIELLKQAEHLLPDNPVLHYNLGVVRKAQGLLAQAAEHYRRAIQLKPDYVEAHGNLGEILRELGMLDTAQASLQEALRLKPDYADAYTNLGTLFRQRGLVSQALSCFQRALHLNSQSARTHNNLAVLLAECGRTEEALAFYRNAHFLEPTFVEALNNQGSLLRKCGRVEEALQSFREALRLNPNYAEAHCNLGNLLQAQGRHEEALACYREAIRLQPGFATAHNNLGAALQDEGRLDEALASFDDALRLEPANAESLNNRGRVLLDLSTVEAALASFDRALALQPEFPEAHVNRGMALLLAGRLPEGWPEYEWRVRCKDYPPSALRLPFWDGGQLAGKTILLYAEQGLGDALQFIRYATLVKARGARVYVASPRPLATLLATCPGVDRVLVEDEAVPPEVQLQALLPSLPGIFGTTLETIPVDIPYLSADPARVARVREEVAFFEGFKIGIVWQGSLANRRERGRSLPLAEFAPLARLKGVHLFSLQVGPGREQLTAVAGQFPIIDLGGRPDLASLDDTAAVAKNLDLVISIDTAMAHLAGALGVPVWVPLLVAPNWRWLLQREDSPWYPTVRLFRQRQRGNWEEVFARMCAELGQRL
jgi:tetratricopeptide (TPR) repeat protein